jgi:hypothetical protein
VAYEARGWKERMRHGSGDRLRCLGQFLANFFLKSTGTL